MESGDLDMRQFLFKGKSVDDGHWVTGNSLEIGDDDHIPMIGHTGPGHGVIYTQVDEKTICQYTGQDDSMGIHVYENDILMDNVYHSLIRIVFDDAYGMYMKVLKDGSRFSLVRNEISEEYTVVGNVHDNV